MEINPNVKCPDHTDDGIAFLVGAIDD